MPQQRLLAKRTSRDGELHLSHPSLNHRLTAIDASFLYFEKKEAAMHIGSVSLFEGEIAFDNFVAMINSKMHLLPRYQQVVTPDPFGIGHPTWEFDESFDIKQHIFKVQIDAPGGEAELIELAGRIFTPMMDRRKPLRNDRARTSLHGRWGLGRGPAQDRSGYLTRSAEDHACSGAPA